MTEHDPAAPPQTPPPGQTPSETPYAPEPRRRKRRWLIGLGVVVLVLILLVLLAPTIASTGPVRSMILSRINASMPGRLTVDDWSLGWLSGVSVTGVELYDAQDAQILAVPRLRTDLGLLDAVRGNLNLGQTVVDVNLTQLVRDEQGVTNYEKALGIEPAPDDDEPPSPLPDLSGQITVNVLGGTIMDRSLPEQAVHLEPGTISLNVPDINGPITNEIDLSYHVNDNAPARIKASGTIDAIENNTVQIDTLVADQALNLSNVDLVALSPFVGMTLDGIVNGSLTLKANGLADVAGDGQLVAQNLAASGGPLAEGDRFATEQLTLPIKIAQRVIDGQTMLVFENVALQSPQFEVQLQGQVSQAVLANVLAGEAPGGGGTLKLTARVPDVSFLNDLSDTLGLPPDLQLTGGTVNNLITITFVPDRLQVAQTLDADISATQQGQPLDLQPLHTDIAAEVQVGQEIFDIDHLIITLPESQALAVNFAGQITNWASTRDLNLRGNVGYDLDALWETIQPFLSSETRESLNELHIAGSYEHEWTIAGSLPMAGPDGQPVPFDVALRGLAITGGVGVPEFSYQGADIRDLALGLAMNDGRLDVKTLGTPVFNGGSLAFAGVIDLRGEVPRLTTPVRVPLVRDATVNPLLGDWIGKYVNPVFANASQAEGLLNVTLNQCKNLALGEAIMTPASGQAVVTFSLTQMQIANPLGNLILGELARLLGSAGLPSFAISKDVADAFNGEIRDALLVIEDGKVHQELTMMLSDPRRAADVIGTPQAVETGRAVPLTFKGDIRLSNLEEDLAVLLPSAWLSQRIGGDFGETLTEIFPEGIPVRFVGQSTNVKFAWPNLVAQAKERGIDLAKRRLLEELDVPGEGGQILDQILGGRGNRPQRPGTVPSQPQDPNAPPEKPDPLNDLLNQFTRPRNRQEPPAPPQDIGQQRISEPADDRDGQE